MWSCAVYVIFITIFGASCFDEKQFMETVDDDDKRWDNPEHISIPYKWGDEVMLARRRRLIYYNEQRAWPKAVVPYIIEPGIIRYKPEFLKIIALYEAYTCIRYIPWNETVGEIYGLGHQGHIRFVPGNGCYVVGVAGRYNNRGQPISCCSNNMCVHELGHVLGLGHEQANHLREGWMRIHEKNVYGGGWGVSSNDAIGGNERFPYDFSSYMHYGAGGGTGVYSLKFPEIPLQHAYYTMFKEVAISYKCSQLSPCGGQLLGCVNEGYTSIVYGKCQCACPFGLDPATLCAKPLKKVVVPWPKGQYGLPMDKKGCPNDKFQKGSVTFDSNGKETVKQEFCIRTSEDYHFKTVEEEKWNWPLGGFCIYKVGDKCPFGFDYGSISFGQATAGKITGQIPSGHYGKSVSIDFCCQYRGFHSNPILLPTEKPFTIFRRAPLCQTITGMRKNQQYLNFYGRNFKSTGSVPNYRTWPGVMRMTMCHYTKKDMNCGDGIVLDNNHKTTTIEINAKGRTDLECTWIIRGDNEKGTLVLDFEKMNIKKNRNNCVDRVYVKHALMGQGGLDYCGQGLDHSIRSITNKIMVKFFTYGNSESSFKANIKWIPNEDQCYDPDDRGVSYNGHVNYTRLFKPCLKWAQVGKCMHNPFREGEGRDNLDGNYCRNPDNSFRPWCYTNSDDKVCLRDHCDVCGVEVPHDKVDYCDKLKKEGFCQQDAKIAAQYCPATCTEFLSPSNKNIQKHGEIKCGKPDSPNDGALIGQEKLTYSLGERVHFKCKSSSSVISSICMTSGNWSSVPYACPVCPFGSAQLHGFCYINSGDNGVASYEDAKSICVKLGGAVVAPINKEENDVVIRASGHSNTWIGITDTKNEGTWVYDDGSKMTWNNWKKNTHEPNGRRSENCALIDGNGAWLDIACSNTWQLHTVCKVPKNIQQQCNDFYSDRCARLVKDSPNMDMCSDFPEYAMTFCRRTCRMCGNNQGQCVAETVNSNVEFLDFKGSTKTLSVGEKAFFGCKKYTVKVRGDEVRLCQADGSLTGHDLQCDECPLGYASSKHACHGLVPGKLLNLDQARKACSEVGGYVAMAKSPAENDVINKVALGEPVWLGIRLTRNDNKFIWEDESFVHWEGEQKIKMSPNHNCIALDMDKTWKPFKCDQNIKLNTVCTVPKKDSFACFDMEDKGVTYDGTVNVTSSGTSCLPWTKTTECPYNAYLSTNSLHILDHNYCRNPDNSQRPWCYTTDCNREYCDVCRDKTKNIDLKTDCGIQRDNEVCTRDEMTARKECAGTCRDLLPDSKHIYYRDVKCQQPNIPIDGEVISKTRLEYHVGDVVSIRCKRNNKFVINTTCLTSGSWTQAGIACSECPVGDLSKDGMCYKWFDFYTTQEKASQTCAEIGGFLPTPKSYKENEIIKSFNRQKTLWLAGKLDDSSGLFEWYNGSRIDWTNWDQSSPNGRKCIQMLQDGLWNNADCNFLFTSIRVLCVFPNQKLKNCKDVLDKQCSHLLIEDPSMCKKREQFSRVYCPKTCGLCTTGVTKCPLPPTAVNIVSSTSQDLSLGDYVSYQCPKFKYPSSGNTERACQLDGTLTGSPLECGNTCPIGAVLRDGVCYRYMRKLRTYLKAREECKALDGLIAFPRNKAENDFFIGLIKPVHSIWIGISDADKEGDFVFEDGTRPSWEAWAPYEPNNKNNEDCGVLQRNRGWNDFNCDGEFYFICASRILRTDKCYNAKDKGVSYDGLVNTSKSGASCVPWSIAATCPYNPFKGGEERNILYGNYCRNPDATFSPWCYTDASKCEKQYCDVCKANDGQSTADYSTVRCKAFNLPDGSMVVIGEDIKTDYKVGDIIHIACDGSNENITSVTCLTSGKWSPLVLYCKGASTDCKDGLVGRCERFLAENLKMCEDFPVYAKVDCAKTCGVCGADDVTCDVSAATSSKFTLSTNESSLSVGQTVTYRCKDDLIEQKGDSVRLCQNNGVLSGTPIVCKDKDDLDTDVVGLSDIKNRDREIPYINVFFADNVLYKIRKHGTIIAWEYYSSSPVKTAFQVWRPVNGVRYELIGQNIVTTGQDKQERRDIPPKNRIKVQPGDVIGIINGGSGGVKFTECDINKHPDWGFLRWSSKLPSTTSIGAGDVISFKVGDKACVLFPMRAIMVITE